MKCFFCKGQMKEGATTFMTEVDNCVIIIKNVPARVCSQCEEAVFSMETAQRIEEMVSSIKSTKTEIAVVNFEEKVA